MPNKVYLFIAISALIHLSVIGIGSQQINELVIPLEHGRSAISVEITKSKATVRQRIIEKPEQAAIRKSVAEKTDESISKVPSVLNTDKNDSLSNLNTTQDISTKNVQALESQLTESEDIELTTPVIKKAEDAQAEINTEAIIVVLREELSKYFYYPKSAQRKNWEGLVVLSFIIMPDGVIHKININKSSGYEVLDNAAVEALGEVKRPEELALALNGNSHEQLLPITYRLTD